MKNLTFKVAYTENDATSDIEICALACKGYKDDQGVHKTVLLGDRWCVYPGNEKTPDYHMSYLNAGRKVNLSSSDEKVISEKVITIELGHAGDDVTEILLLAYVSKRNKKAGNIYDAYADGSITLSDTNADDETITDISLSNGRLANEVTIHVGTLFRKPQRATVEASANNTPTFTAVVTKDSVKVSTITKKAIQDENNEPSPSDSKDHSEWDLAIFHRGSSTISTPEVIKSLGGEVEYI